MSLPLEPATSPADLVLLAWVVDFAAVKHRGQRRKGAAEEPYFNMAEVTDDKRLPKAERKRLQVENAPHKSDRAKLIKIADKTSNLRGIANSPPLDWDLARPREYFAWAARVVEGCRGINPWLESIFDNAHRDGLARLAVR